MREFCGWLRSQQGAKPRGDARGGGAVHWGSGYTGVYIPDGGPPGAIVKPKIDTIACCGLYSSTGHLRLLETVSRALAGGRSGPESSLQVRMRY